MNEEIRKPNISEWSYQRYAQFYKKDENKDADFEKKINEIKRLILEDKETDLYAIAKLSGCTYEEAILKIGYLKNKRVIGDYYVDSAAGIVSLCSDEEEATLKKYERFLYGRHCQIDSIAIETNQSEEKVWNDLKYLDEKKLINGVILNDVDRRIVYYSIEKRLKAKDYISINCPNCGRLVDIQRGSKGRCPCCDTIIEDDVMEKALELLKLKESREGE